MTDLVERVARAIAENLNGADPNWANVVGRAAIEAHTAGLAEDGFVIHRFHHWRPQPGWPYDERARVVCTRCGAFEDGLGAQVTSCPIPPSAGESK